MRALILVLSVILFWRLVLANGAELRACLGSQLCTHAFTDGAAASLLLLDSSLFSALLLHCNPVTVLLVELGFRFVHGA